MNKIDTAASKGFRIASRLIGYIGLALCIALFIVGYAMPQGFWIKGASRYKLEFLKDWGRLDLAENKNKLMILAIVAGSILIVAILFRIISACCKTTVEEAVEAECEKAVRSVHDSAEKAEQKVGKSVEKTEKKLGKSAGKVRTYISDQAKKVIPEDKMPYVEKAGDFLKKYSTVILASAATLTAVVVITNAKENSRRRAERRRFLRSLM